MGNDENKYTDEFFRQYEENYINRKPRAESEINKLKKRGKRQKRLKIKPAAILSVFAAVAVAAGALIFVSTNNHNTSVSADKAKKDISAEDISNEILAQAEKPDLYAKKTEKTLNLANETESEYALLIDAKSNEIIAEKNSDAKIFPASLTKVLTLLVAAENIDNLNDTFKMTAEITDAAYKAEASVAGFSAGEKIKIMDLLYGVILPSGADATQALAEYVSGSEEKFVELMNKKAADLGLKSAHFCNTSGLHDDNHYCTLRDIAVIMKEAMKNNLCRQILSTYQYTTNATTEHPEGILLTSTLFSRMTGEEPEGATIIAGKTGFTSQAGNCIVSYAVSDSGREYIFVTAMAHGMWKSVFDHINIYSDLAQ